MKELSNPPTAQEFVSWIVVLKNGDKTNRVKARLWFDAKREALRQFGDDVDSVLRAPEREQSR